MDFTDFGFRGVAVLDVFVLLFAHKLDLLESLHVLLVLLELVGAGLF